jgi:hypothetical protein
VKIHFEFDSANDDPADLVRISTSVAHTISTKPSPVPNQGIDRGLDKILGESEQLRHESAKIEREVAHPPPIPTSRSTEK